MRSNMEHPDEVSRRSENLLEDTDNLPFRDNHKADSHKDDSEVPKAQASQRSKQKRVYELGLRFEDVTYTVAKQDKVDGKWESMAVDLLQGISGKAVRSELTGILGPSGAGKSTFLDALAGRIEQKSIGGTVWLDGQRVTGSYIRRNSAYVMQEDLLFPFLTVTETLLFSAEVRLPNKLSRAEKADRVKALISKLDLEFCAQTYIGDEKHRGISGGEKRRVSIGVDIIHGPALLFLDEPTSGLDSTSAFIVMEKLLEIAIGGSTILLTIHQPSYRIQMMFGRVIILARGKVVYQGAPDQLAGYIEAFGWEVPKNENDMEYFIEIIKELDQSETGLDPLVQFQRDGFKTPAQAAKPRAKPTSESAISKSAPSTPVHERFAHEDGGFDHSLSKMRSPRTRELQLASHFYTGKPIVNVLPGSSPLRIRNFNASSHSPPAGFHFRGPMGDRTPTSIHLETASTVAGDQPPKSEAESVLHAEGWKYQNGWFREVGILSWRAGKNVLRSPELFVSRQLKAMILSFLLATLLKGPKPDLNGIYKRTAYFVAMLSVVLFSSNDALPTFIEERFIFMKETSSKAYRASSYTVAGLLVALPTNALQAVTYVLIAWWALKFDGGAGGFMTLSLIFYALVVTSHSFTVLVSALVPNFVAGYAVVISLSALTFISCGYLVKRSEIPVYWIWLHYMSTMKYALEAAMRNEFRDGICFSEYPVLPNPGPLGSTVQVTPLPLSDGNTTPCYLRGDGVLNAFDMTQFPIGANIAFIVMWGFIYRFLIYVVLRILSKSQRK